MKTRYTVALSMIAGAALGGAAIQGLHAQAKLKAYSIGEIEVTDASAQPGYLPAVRKAVEEIDRNQPLIDPRTEDSYLAEQAQYPRYYSMLLGLFAAVATGLANARNSRSGKGTSATQANCTSAH